MNVGPSSALRPESRGGLNVTREKKDEPLRECVHIALDRYLKQMEGHLVEGLYEMVLREVEPPMLQTVLHHCRGNQTRAAEMLGMSRSTLRKKLAHYGLTT
jgi:Fis family transcriptional regulator